MPKDPWSLLVKTADYTVQPDKKTPTKVKTGPSPTEMTFLDKHH